jgi:dolichol-phosphate mannosyltransferase
VTGVRRFVRFNAVGATGIGVQLLVLWTLTRADVHYLPATVLAVACAVVHNFVWHRRWTWGDRREGRDAPWPAELGAFAAANGLVSLGGNVVVMSLAAGLAGMPPVTANLVAIGATGVLNFWLGDRIVFRAQRAPAGIQRTISPRPRLAQAKYGMAVSVCGEPAGSTVAVSVATPPSRSARNAG